MRLTDNEIRDITKYLESGKPLPDFYRFLLFEEKLDDRLFLGDIMYEVRNISRRRQNERKDRHRRDIAHRAVKHVEREVRRRKAKLRDL